ncbi:MAG TPA: HAD family hydrolase [Anaerolineales bacterium]|nr:HAD family hydrolase [Anaerolineales bacterium]
MTSRTRTFHCAAVLFDLDGVLIDSTRCVERHWRQWADAHGLDADSILPGAHGMRNIDTMRKIAPHLDVEQEAAQFAAQEVADTEGVIAVDGAVSLLAGLEGTRWAVVTSCSADLAQARLRTAGLSTPPMLITGDDVSRGKPEPDPYLLAASRLELRPADCIVVEDAPAGIAAGKRAGMQVIAIASTYSRQQLRSSAADVLIDRLSTLILRPTSIGKIQLSVPSD